MRGQWRANIQFLLALDVIALMCSSNVNYMSNINDQSVFVMKLVETWWEETGGRIMFLVLRMKTTCACLDGLRLKLVFQWKPDCFFCLSPHKIIYLLLWDHLLL